MSTRLSMSILETSYSGLACYAMPRCHDASCHAGDCDRAILLVICAPKISALGATAWTIDGMRRVEEATTCHECKCRCKVCLLKLLLP
jgi:hypothetical protein